METFLKPLIEKKPDKLILHVGTNNCPYEPSEIIIKKLINLKFKIEQSQPSCKVIISTPIIRFDNAKAQLTQINVLKTFLIKLYPFH